MGFILIIGLIIVIIAKSSYNASHKSYRRYIQDVDKIHGGYSPRSNSLKEQLVSTINQTNRIIERISEIRNAANNNPDNVSFSNRNVLKGYVPQILMKLETISSIIDRDQSLMLESVSGPYGQSTNAISWMTWIQQWFDNYEQFINRL